MRLLCLVRINASLVCEGDVLHPPKCPVLLWRKGGTPPSAASPEQRGPAWLQFDSGMPHRRPRRTFGIAVYCLEAGRAEHTRHLSARPQTAEMADAAPVAAGDVPPAAPPAVEAPPPPPPSEEPQPGLAQEPQPAQAEPQPDRQPAEDGAAEPAAAVKAKEPAAVKAEEPAAATEALRAAEPTPAAAEVKVEGHDAAVEAKEEPEQAAEAEVAEAAAAAEDVKGEAAAVEGAVAEEQVAEAAGAAAEGQAEAPSDAALVARLRELLGEVDLATTTGGLVGAAGGARRQVLESAGGRPACLRRCLRRCRCRPFRASHPATHRPSDTLQRSSYGSGWRESMGWRWATARRCCVLRSTLTWRRRWAEWVGG